MIRFQHDDRTNWHSLLRSFVCLVAALALVSGWFSASATAASSNDTTAGLTLRLLGPATAPEIRTRSDLNFDVEYLPADEPWVTEIISRSDAARRHLQRETGDTFLVRLRVVLASNREMLMRLVGGWAEHSSAVAIPSQRTMIINVDAMRTGPDAQVDTTLLHEMSHLYLGVQLRRPVPRWLDEGIAQLVSQEGTAEDEAQLVWARLFGSIIPFRDLERSFPTGADRQRLAYRQSASITRYLVTREHAGSLRALISSLTADDSGEKVARHWNPIERDNLEAQWRKTLGAGGAWATVLLSSSLFWGIAIALTVVAYILVRLRRRRLRREWAEEEEMFAELGAEEEKIWGEHDEEARTWKPEDDEAEEMLRDPYEKSSYDEWENGGRR